MLEAGISDSVTLIVAGCFLFFLFWHVHFTSGKRKSSPARLHKQREAKGAAVEPRLSHLSRRLVLPLTAHLSAA